MARPILLCAALFYVCLARAQPVPEFLMDLAGTWDVQQRMWPSPGAAAVELPPAVAQRQVVQGLYVQEVMQSAEGGSSQAPAFTRHATLNFNPVTRQYEYASLDSRAPQLMVERGQLPQATNGGQALQLQGGTFLAPEWGTLKNVRFSYRLTVGAVVQGKQWVRLYLTPLSVLPKKEFLAFEYVYSKKT